MTTYPLDNRHPATLHLLAQFDSARLHPDLRDVSDACARLAHEMAANLNDGPELSFGLRQLLLAMDAFCRAAVQTPLA